MTSENGGGSVIYEVTTFSVYIKRRRWGVGFMYIYIYIDKCRICGTEGETIEHIISSCTVLAQSEYKKRHDIFAKIIHMNWAVKL
jgi:hypothetical protein